MKSVLLTGASGFLGNVIKRDLTEFQITSLGRFGSDVECDLSREVPALRPVDLVIHAAGKAHVVPRSEEEANSFFSVNVKGTENLLSGLERTSKLPLYFVFISSVAVYGKSEGNLIGEEQPLTATDPYGMSKILAEEIVQDWCCMNDVKCTIIRLPLIAGHNPPGNLQSMIKAIQKGYYFDVAGGRAKKSMVLAEDVARIVPSAAGRGGVFNLTDGLHPTFSQLSELIALQLGKRKPGNIPLWLAKGIAKAGDIFGEKAPINSAKLRKITSDLTFDDSKARRELGWKPTPVLEGFRIL